MGYVSKWTGEQLDRSVHHAAKISKTADYNVGIGDSGKITELASSTTADKTFTLPSVATDQNGYIWGFANRSSYVLTILASDADTIHKGSSSITLDQHEMATLRYDHDNTNFDLVSTGGKIAIHASSHEAGNADALTMTNLPHEGQHEQGGIDQLTGILLQDTAANRPAAGTANRFFLATDTMELSRDNGTAWESIGVLGGLDLTAHSIRHKNGGADELDASELAGALGTSGDIIESDGAALNYVGPNNRYYGLVLVDAAANRPAAGISGRWFIASDTLAISHDDGAAWNTVGTLGGLDLTSHATRHEAGGADALTGKVSFDVVDFNAEYDYGVVTADITIDWANGNNQKITLGADITLTFSNMSIGHKQLKAIQDSTGGRIPTLPTGKWLGGTSAVFSTGGSAEDILSIYYDAASYYYQLTKGWS